MHDAIGADTSRLNALLTEHQFTFLVEDPATVWDQGPQRYPVIASKYPQTSRVAVDINIVDRYQNVYPTKQQTGAELFGLVHLASQSFGRVALYIENSLAGPDLALLSSAASTFDQGAWVGSRFVTKTKLGGGVRWQGDCNVDGRPWPVKESEIVWLPSGSHVLERASGSGSWHLLSSSGSLTAARYQGPAIEFSYEAESREIARFSNPVSSLQVDGQAFPLVGPREVAMLPRGRHTVIAWPQTDESGSKSRRNPGQAVFPDRGSQ